MGILNYINNYLYSLSEKKYIVFMLLLSYIIYIPLIPFFQNYDIGGTQFLINASFIGKLINGSLIIPFIETFIFQYLAIGIIRSIKKIKDNNCLIIIISAIAFSLSHYYNVLYIFYSFIMGIFLAYTYILYEKKNYHPFLMVMAIHALRNTITTLILTFL